MPHQTSTYNFKLHKPFLSIIGVLVLMAALPLAVLIVQKSQDIRQKAVDITPITPDCNPLNNTIYLYPSGTPASCQNLQEALDHVPSGGTDRYTIKIYPGTYEVSSTTTPFTLEINHKNPLTIEGDTSSNNAVQLLFTQHNGGIHITNSIVDITWLAIGGGTMNGTIYVENNATVSLAYLKVSDPRATAIHTDQSTVSIVNSQIQSIANAIHIRRTANFTVGNNVISGRSGLVVDYASGTILANKITGATSAAIDIDHPETITLTKNTVADNRNEYAVPSLRIAGATSQTQLTFQDNIIAQNTKGISADTNVGTYTFTHNDIWNLSTNIEGISNPIGQDGNISADPLFGADYCINPTSPAIYGDIAQSQYMGTAPVCNPPSSPFPPASPTPPPTPPITASCIATASANLVTHTAPYTHRFQASGNGAGINGSRWDFDRNGTWDEQTAYKTWIDHTFTEPGTYRPQFQISDQSGWSSNTCDAWDQVEITSPASPSPSLEPSPSPEPPTSPSPSPSPSPTPNSNPADANGDGIVNLIDYDVFLGKFLDSLNNNGTMTLSDYDIFLTNFIQALNN